MALSSAHAHRAKSVWGWFDNARLAAAAAPGTAHSLHVPSLPIPALPHVGWDKPLAHLRCRWPREPIHLETILSKTLLAFFFYFFPLIPDYFCVLVWFTKQ